MTCSRIALFGLSGQPLPVSLSSRENQHELCVYARKFANMLPFGCWCFLNSPSIAEEITRERVEMLGTTFIPQQASYRCLVADGGVVTRQHVQRDFDLLFRGLRAVDRALVFEPAADERS